MCSKISSRVVGSAVAIKMAMAESRVSTRGRICEHWVSYESGSIVWSCGVKMSNAHCSAPHVAVLAQQALKATHTCMSINFQGWKSRAIFVVNETQVDSQKPTSQKPRQNVLNNQKSSYFETSLCSSIDNRSNIPLSSMVAVQSSSVEDHLIICMWPLTPSRGFYFGEKGIHPPWHSHIPYCNYCTNRQWHMLAVQIAAISFIYSV